MTPAPPSSTATRVFLALGGVVAVIAAVRILQALARASEALSAALATAEAGPGASPAWRFALGHPAALLFGGLIALCLVIAVSVGVVARRPWARPAALALLAAGAAGGFTGAAYQLASLFAPAAGRSREAAEIGFGPILGFWRVAGGLAALVLGIFCVAAMRRLASAELRREFSRDSRRPGAPPPV